MDKSKADHFIAANGKYFPNSKLMLIRDRLEVLDDSRFVVLSSLQFHDPMTMLLISIFLGGLGIDRFLLKDIAFGILKLLTGGLCGILWIIDIILISEKTKERNYQDLVQLLY